MKEKKEKGKNQYLRNAGLICVEKSSFQGAEALQEASTYTPVQWRIFKLKGMRWKWRKTCQGRINFTA